MRNNQLNLARGRDRSWRRNRRGGQNMVEFALSMTLMVIVSLSVFQFALVGFAINSVKYVVRKECRYAAIHATDNTGGVQSDTGITNQWAIYLKEAGMSAGNFTSFTITPIANDETRKSGNSIEISVVYSLKGKLLINQFFSKSLVSYPYTATATIE